MALIGYTRVSTTTQAPSRQRTALLEVGVEPTDIWSDVVTVSKDAAERPEWATLAAYAREGDTVVVWRIDRLGRSLIDVPTSDSTRLDAAVGVFTSRAVTPCRVPPPRARQG